MLRLAFFLLTALLTCAVAYARVPFGKDVLSSPDEYFSTREQGVDSMAFLPPPPAYDSLLFAQDKAAYEYGLSLRHTERGAQALKDCDVHHLPETFSEAFGGPITEQDMPELFLLMKRAARELSSLSTRTAKKGYRRLRPYVLYNAATCQPEGEEQRRNSGSYPSGHSSMGWGLALILSEINPGRKEVLLKRGYEYGQSRVICGYHWQSDVDAGRLAGAAGVANLHANDDFSRQLHKAKEEFARLAEAGKVRTQ
ncbi:MAG: phosphatase PAP2 family protein [Desulfovibrio sp.]|nr:phosphatase PAP2 family protein [Desulfovibrio sp.]